jgi:uncharacterized protein (TIGR04255 family)
MQQLTLPMQFAVSGGGPLEVQAESVVNWRFTDDVGHAFVVALDTATLEVGSAYQGVEDFARRFREGLQALESSGVHRSTRLGLRYLNMAEIRPEAEQEWREWFRPEVIGWPGSNLLSPETRLSASVTQTQLRTPPAGELAVAPAEVQAIIRHGWFPPGTGVPGLATRPTTYPAYLLDIDFFIEYSQEFQTDTLIEQFRALHRQIDRFFYWSLTENGARRFGLEVRDDSDRPAETAS